VIAPVIKPCLRAKGFTLVELVITIAVLSIALLAVAQSLQFSAQFGADTLWQTKTVELVQAYADEIQTKRFDENTPVGGVPACDSDASAASCSLTLGADATEQRSGGINDYDDVDDYNDLDKTPPVDSQGNLRTDYAGYRVRVTVSYAGTDLGLPNNSDAKLIAITITPPGQSSLPFSVYRGNF